jgi:hypothetical protein
MPLISSNSKPWEQNFKEKKIIMIYYLIPLLPVLLLYMVKEVLPVIIKMIIGFLLFQKDPILHTVHLKSITDLGVGSFTI